MGDFQVNKEASPPRAEVSVLYKKKHQTQALFFFFPILIKKMYHCFILQSVELVYVFSLSLSLFFFFFLWLQ
jgi:hypothetical protein